MALLQATVEMVTALVHDGPLLFLVGLITVALGLALVLVHNVWSGGAPTVIVTLIGWITLIKGSLILLLPPDTAVDFFLGQLRYRQLFNGYAAIVLVLGFISRPQVSDGHRPRRAPRVAPRYGLGLASRHGE